MSEDDVKDLDQSRKDVAGRAKPDMPDEKDTGEKVSIVFRDKIEIHYQKPLAQYNAGRNQAFRAYARDRNKTPIIALVCDRHSLARISSIPVYATIINPFLFQLVEHGVIYWPPAKQERLVFFYVDPMGKPIQTEGEKSALGWRQDDVIAIILKPMVNILLDFRDKDFVHGNIRASNIFDVGGQGKTKKIMLGDCLSTPPSFAQPVIYETINRSMAQATGRGRGTLEDDLYALGVTLAVAMRQHDPMEGLSTKEIIQEKISHGSYGAITGKDRFKGEILELLRGLLHDEPSQRWTLNEITEWMNGQRQSHKQPPLTKKAQRPIPFGGEKYLLPRLLAMDLEIFPGETKKIIEDESLPLWLERSLDNPEMAGLLEKSVANAKAPGMGPGYEERLVSYVSMVLDQGAPLRYKNIQVMGDSVGIALAEAVGLKHSLNPYAEIFNFGIISNWLALQTNAKIDVLGLHNKFELCKRYLRSAKMGEGIERCLYLLAPECICLSETLKDHFVLRPDDLLRAFEDLCQKKRVPSQFLDRHIMAFLFQRDQKLIEPYAYDVNTNERHRVVLATLKCLAGIQKRYEIENVPALAKSLALMLPAVYKRFHDRSIRDKLQKSVEEFAEQGDLQKMAALLDNADLIGRDFSAFKKAMVEYDAIEKERQKLESTLTDKKTFGLNIGREWAVIVSCSLAAIIILGTAFAFFSQKGGGF